MCMASPQVLKLLPYVDRAQKGHHWYLVVAPAKLRPFSWYSLHVFYYYWSSIHSLVFSSWAGFWQEPELSQLTGMAVANCILGKFLGVGCHCFMPPLDIPTFAVRCLHVRNDARDPSSERRKCEQEWCPVILPRWQLPCLFGIFYMPQIYDMGPTALLPLRRKACWGFLPVKFRRV
jgi:hypothetical protein